MNTTGWPPRAGDLWRDSYPRGGYRPRPNELWFATDDAASGGVKLIGTTGSRDDPERVRVAYGPLTLVHREETAA